MPGTANDIIVVIVTVSGVDDGLRISREILNSRLVACVSVIPGVQSMYWWEGKLVEEQEAMMMAKTTRAQYEKLERRIKELHPYAVPEIIAIPLVNGSSQYIGWINGQVAN